jgi:hypothetical protein
MEGMEPCDLECVHRALVQQWGIWPLGPSRLAREALIEELGRRVDFLLRHDLERLMTSMYLLDVPEEKFAEAVRRPAHEGPARILAEIILEREVEKMQTRQQYTRRERTEITVRIEGRRRPDDPASPES